MAYSLLRLGIPFAAMGIAWGSAGTAAANDADIVSRPRLPEYIVPSRYYNSDSLNHAIPAASPVVPDATLPTMPVAANLTRNELPPRVQQNDQSSTDTTERNSLPVLAPPPTLGTPMPVMAHEASPANSTLHNIHAAVSEHQTSAPPTPDFNQHTDTPHEFSLGIEGYYTEYEEPFVELSQEGSFSGVTASYTYQIDSYLYTSLEARGSVGEVDSESIGGSMDGIKQWEVESRWLLGAQKAFSSDQTLRAYIGLGARYFVDESKGKISSLGDYGYDRRSTLLYLPIGVTYEFAALGLSFAPNIEIDPLLWGNVNSRLSAIPANPGDPAYYSIDNEQSRGLGFRGEILVGQHYENGLGWQFGPFFRYWSIPNSNVTIDPNGDDWVEPKNSRIQAGATLKMLF